MTDLVTIHYDIRAVSGVTRAACGHDNRINHNPLEPAPFQCTTNRNLVTCEGCSDKIELLERLGGDAIQAPQDEDNRRWFVDAMKQALREDDTEGDAEYKAWHRDVVMSTLQEYHNEYFLSTRKLIMEAVADTIHAGKFKFDETQLRGQIHRVLNNRVKEKEDVKAALREDRAQHRQSDVVNMTRSINHALNTRLAEASYIVGRDFMESPKVKMLLVDAAKAGSKEALESPIVKSILATQARIGAELQFDDSREERSDLVRQVLEDVLKENPTQFVQNIYAPDEALTPAEVFRQTKGLLASPTNLRSAYVTRVKPIVVNFDSLNHQDLGNWAVANDLVRQWQYDTNMTRSMLKLRQEDGELIHPGEDEPRN